MAHQAQHARSSKQHKSAARRTVPLLGLAASGLSALSAPAAHADTFSSVAPDTAAQRSALSEIGGVQLYPIAGTPLDLLSNSLRVPMGGMDMTTLPVTAPFRDGLPLRELPLVGSVLP
jgi:hypothetical protein